MVASPDRRSAYGTGLRQLTNARGMTTDPDTIHVELLRP